VGGATPGLWFMESNASSVTAPFCLIDSVVSIEVPEIF
jgi:hypothetical protein